jgi:hypothetical protein
VAEAIAAGIEADHRDEQRVRGHRRGSLGNGEAEHALTHARAGPERAKLERGRARGDHRQRGRRSGPPPVIDGRPDIGLAAKWRIHADRPRRQQGKAPAQEIRDARAPAPPRGGARRQPPRHQRRAPGPAPCLHVDRPRHAPYIAPSGEGPGADAVRDERARGGYPRPSAGARARPGVGRSRRTPALVWRWRASEVAVIEELYAWGAERKSGGEPGGRIWGPSGS